jgi:hypothetical protein
MWWEKTIVGAIENSASIVNQGLIEECKEFQRELRPDITLH